MAPGPEAPAVVDRERLREVGPHDPADVRIPAYLPDHSLVRQDLAAYYNEITRARRDGRPDTGRASAQRVQPRR